MPYIHSKISSAVSEKQETELKEKLGKAIELIPGKSEQWLMTAFEGEQHMYFRGKNDEPCAFVDVKIYGRENPAAFRKLTGEICRIYSEVLSIAPDHIYVAYEPIANWGWNGDNF